MENITINGNVTVNVTNTSATPIDRTNEVLISNDTTLSELISILTNNLEMLKAAGEEEKERMEKEEKLRKAYGEDYEYLKEMEDNDTDNADDNSGNETAEELLIKSHCRPGPVFLRTYVPMMAKLECESGGVIEAFNNGYCVYDNGDRKTVVWILDCCNYTYRFTPLCDSEKEYMKQNDEISEDIIGSLPWYQAVMLRGEDQIWKNSEHPKSKGTMPNGEFIYGIYGENDIESWRDLLFYTAQVLGCYCQINRQGQLELRKYGNMPVMQVSDKQRFSSSFSDFITRYTAVNSTNQKTTTAEYYALTPDDGLTMNLGVNPLLQFGLKDTREKIIRNILNDISRVRYVPFDSETIGNPALDIGDVISFSGGHADDTQIAAITGMTVKINGKTTLKCVGKNPRLSQAKSKNDKNIAGLLNSVEVGKITVHSYMNSSPFTVGENDAEIVSLEFASQDDTDAEFHGSILIDITADEVQKTASGKLNDQDISVSWSEDGRATLKVTYVINDNVINTYYPFETWQSGKHILNLYYPISKLDANAYNTFKVRLSVTNGFGFIDRMQALCTISGQGLSAGNVWDGRLSFEEKFVPVADVGSLSFRKAIDIVAPYTEVPEPIGLVDRFTPARFGRLTALRFIAQPQMNPVIVTEIIEPADRNEMTFNRDYVRSENTFEFQTDYSFTNFEVPIDEGRMSRLDINTEQFARIDSLEVQRNGKL